MLDTSTLERRLISLEKVVFDLQHKFENKSNANNWLESLVGSVSDDAAFLEALEYGRIFRQSEMPFDNDSKVPRLFTED